MYNVYYCIQKILKFQYFTEISVFHRNQEPRFLEKFFLGILVLGSWKILKFQYFTETSVFLLSYSVYIYIYIHDRFIYVKYINTMQA